jgi:hypothetical protein
MARKGITPPEAINVFQLRAGSQQRLAWSCSFRLSALMTHTLRRHDAWYLKTEMPACAAGQLGRCMLDKSAHLEFMLDGQEAGASRGIGRALEVAAVDNGDLFSATARDACGLDDVIAKYPGKIHPGGTERYSACVKRL